MNIKQTVLIVVAILLMVSSVATFVTAAANPDNTQPSVAIANQNKPKPLPMGNHVGVIVSGGPHGV